MIEALIYLLIPILLALAVLIIPASTAVVLASNGKWKGAFTVAATICIPASYTAIFVDFNGENWTRMMLAVPLWISALGTLLALGVGWVRYRSKVFVGQIEEQR
ncbi:MAG: hypothetical protein AAF687_03980 [Pseudomonadota bacterium]